MTLDQLKKFEAHMKDELKIMEVILHYDQNVASEFQEWYINHPYCKGIEELRQIGKKGRDRENKGTGSTATEKRDTNGSH